MKNILVFVVAAFLEIAGCFACWACEMQRRLCLLWLESVVQRQPLINTVNDKKKGLKQTIRHELISYWLIVLYTAIVYGAFSGYRKLLLAHYGISYEDYGIAVIKALGLAKVVLVAEPSVWAGDMKKAFSRSNLIQEFSVYCVCGGL